MPIDEAKFRKYREKEAAFLSMSKELIDIEKGFQEALQTIIDEIESNISPAKTLEALERKIKLKEDLKREQEGWEKDRNELREMFKELNSSV